MNTKLQVLMEKKKLKDVTLAAEINCSAAIVKQWREGTTSPRLLHALRLKDYFGKAISMKDLLSKFDIAKLS